MRSKLMLIALLGLAILPCAGQTSGGGSKKTGDSVLDKFDFGLTFTDKYAKISNTDGTYFNLPGGSLDAAYTFNKWDRRWAVAADFQGEASTQPITLGYGLKQISFVVGPRYTVWRQKNAERKSNFYAQALVGGMHAWDSLFQSSPTAKGVTSTNSFAFQCGGGLNLPVGKKVGLRVGEVDYILTKLPNAYNNFQGDVRFSTGLNFHF